MKDIDHYLKEIISDLPMKDHEKEGFKEELYAHITEHVKELMVKGYTEDEAVLEAIQSFGNERKSNWELKKAIFPFYKVVRYLWNVVFVTAFLCLVSYTSMEYYHPEFTNTLPTESVILGMFLVAGIVGVAEVLYEAVIAEYKSKWLTNPWLFFLIPALFIGGLTSFSFIAHPEQYQEGLWLDLYAIPIGAFAHIISRQLFTLIFIRSRRNHGKGKAWEFKQRE